MIMIGTMTFSAECAMAVAQNFGRIAPVPDFMKLMGPYTISIYEFDDDRADEAMAYLNARYARFDAIEGVTTSVEEWLGVGLALKLLDETQSVTDVLDA
jgi:hypothetical protein